MENETKSNSLTSYVKELVQKGTPKDEIKDQLLAVGWSEDQADAAFSKALVENGVPVPSKEMQSTFGKKSSTVEVALNLFSFVLLGIVTTAIITLFYQIINKYFPDPLILNYRRNIVSTAAVHYSIAALIIAFPIYYFCLRFWFRSFQQDGAKMETRFSRLLTYLVLLVASTTIVGDLIYSLYTFLQGELSARFFLKALTIMFIAGMIFGFYFLERKKIQYRKEVSSKIFSIFTLVISITIVLGIILGFFAAGSPATERKRGLDDQREQDLSALARCISNYAQRHNRLPSSLNELENNTTSSYCANKKDPETGKSYEYRVTKESIRAGSNMEGDFELCANFALVSEDDLNTRGKSSYYYQNSSNIKWQTHSAGQDCDKETVILGKAPIMNTTPPPTPITVTPQTNN